MFAAMKAVREAKLTALAAVRRSEEVAVDLDDALEKHRAAQEKLMKTLSKHQEAAE